MHATVIYERLLLLMVRVTIVFTLSPYAPPNPYEWFMLFYSVKTVTCRPLPTCLYRQAPTLTHMRCQLVIMASQVFLPCLTLLHIAYNMVCTFPAAAAINALVAPQLGRHSQQTTFEDRGGEMSSRAHELIDISMPTGTRTAFRKRLCCKHLLISLLMTLLVILSIFEKVMRWENLYQCQLSLYTLK